MAIDYIPHDNWQKRKQSAENIKFLKENILDQLHTWHTHLIRLPDQLKVVGMTNHDQARRPIENMCYELSVLARMIEKSDIKVQEKNNTLLGIPETEDN